VLDAERPEHESEKAKIDKEYIKKKIKKYKAAFTDPILIQEATDAVAHYPQDSEILLTIDALIDCLLINEQEAIKHMR
jgi:hypothetical protein